MPRFRTQTGQTAADYMGVLLLVWVPAGIYLLAAPKKTNTPDQM